MAATSAADAAARRGARVVCRSLAPMMRRHPIMLITLLALGGCPSSKEIKTARSSAYDVDFAIVYSETLEAVRQIYPEGIDDNPASGVIRTAWQPVSYQSGAGDASQGGGAANGDPSVGGTSASVGGDPTVPSGDPHN